MSPELPYVQFSISIENHQFINTLAGTSGDSTAASDLNAASGTRRITSHMIDCDGRHLVFVDTPGLDSTYLLDARIFTLAARWLEIKYVTQLFAAIGISGYQCSDMCKAIDPTPR